MADETKQELLEQGRLALDGGYYDQAINIFSSIIQTDPNCFDAYVGRGKAQQEKADDTEGDMQLYRSAISDLNDALKLAQGASSIRMQRVELLHWVAMIKTEKEFEHEVQDLVNIALQDCNLLVQEKHFQRDAILIRYQCFDYLLRHADALADADKLIELDRTDDLAWVFRAGAFYTLGRYQDSIRSFDEALRLRKSCSAYSGRGQAYTATGEFQKALSDFKAAEELNEGYADFSKRYRARCLLGVGRFRDAIRDYKQTISDGNNNAKELAEWYFLRGYAHFRLGEKSKAEADRQKAVEKDNKWANASYENYQP